MTAMTIGRRNNQIATQEGGETMDKMTALGMLREYQEAAQKAHRAYGSVSDAIKLEAMWSILGQLLVAANVEAGTWSDDQPNQT